MTKRTDDIVKRLRRGHALRGQNALLKEAAAEIESLRSHLSEFRTPFSSTLSHEAALERLLALNKMTYAEREMSEALQIIDDCIRVNRLKRRSGDNLTSSQKIANTLFHLRDILSKEAGEDANTEW